MEFDDFNACDQSMLVCGVFFKGCDQGVLVKGVCQQLWWAWWLYNLLVSWGDNYVIYLSILWIKPTFISNDS